MPTINRSVQNAIAPFAWFFTLALWAASWMEIVSHGSWRLHRDCSKFYLAVMAGYAGVAEIAKWSVNLPTDPSEDPALERLHRGLFFIWLWAAPFMAALFWQVFDQTVPLPDFVERIALGLVGIFILKQTSRQFRHKKHGVVEDEADESADGEPAFEESVYRRVAAAPEGMLVGEIIGAFPDVSRPTLYRAFDKLVKARRLTRTGKPRTPEVRYHRANSTVDE